MSRSLQNNIIYLSYGQGPHADELVYAVLSALRILGSGNRDYRIILYTDNPSAIRDLPVHVELLSDKVLADWAGPFDFNHRRKIFTIKHALEKFGNRLIYCDTDTFFLKHPNKLFAHIRPGHTVMHIGEYHLHDSCASKLADFVLGHNLHDRAGQRWNITPTTAMFNAGVIGLHESDISLLGEVLYLTDQIYPHVRIPTIEQFAFSVCLDTHTKLRESYDIVHHYWRPTDRALFREQLSRVLHDSSFSSNEQRFRQLLPHRPSRGLVDRSFQSPAPTLGARIRMALGRLAECVGVKYQLKRAWHWIIRQTELVNEMRHPHSRN
jgi:hypothetical protein